MRLLGIVFEEVDFLYLMCQLANIDTGEVESILDPVAKVVEDIFVVLSLFEGVEELLLLIEEGRLVSFPLLFLLLLLFLFEGEGLKDAVVGLEFVLHGKFLRFGFLVVFEVVGEEGDWEFGFLVVEEGEGVG